MGQYRNRKVRKDSIVVDPEARPYGGQSWKQNEGQRVVAVDIQIDGSEGEGWRRKFFESVIVVDSKGSSSRDERRD